MQSTPISLSPSHSIPTPSLPSRAGTETHQFPTTTSSDHVVLPSRTRSSSFPSSSLRLRRRPWNGMSHVVGPKTKKDAFPIRASASLTESAGEEGKAGRSIMKTLELGVLFGLWYLFNIYFNIYNKQVLKVYHYPWTITLIHFAIGSVLVLLMWITNLYKRPKIGHSQLLAILPLAAAHTLGTIFLNMSLGKVAVSFTHTVKALEPIFTVVLSAMFHREFPSPWVVATLFPIVGGVALASATEASFNWAGFWSAMASNLTNQSRNVLSKKIMVKKEDALDNITLFSVITIMSFILQFPATCYVEGFKFTPAYFNIAAQQGMDIKLVLIKSSLAGLCFHAYQQVAYIILERVSPVTHSVGNCVKRVVVIASSVLFFRTPVTFINLIGTGVALVGVFLYSRAKRIEAKPKAA